MDNTCGNCRHGMVVGGERMQCLIEGNLPNGCAPLHFSHDTGCAGWHEEPLSIGKRFEQLELVAVLMWDCINDNCAPIIAEKYRKKLEALGVSVDG